MLKIGIISDAHLGKVQYGLPERENDFYEAFEEACGKLAQEGIDVLLLAGDIFDSSRPLNRALFKFENAVSKIIETGTQVYAISGDHDFPKRRDLPPMMLYRRLGITYLWTKEKCVEAGDYVVCGIQNHPKSFKEKLVDALKEIDKTMAQKEGKTRILMLHQGLSNFSKYASEISLEELPRNIDVYALGHLHSFIYKKLGDKLLVYPGSLEIVDASEIQEYLTRGKGPVIVKVGDGIKIEKIRLNSIRPQILLNINDLSKLEERIEESLSSYRGFTKKPIVHIYVSEDIGRERIKEVREKFKEQVLYMRFRKIESIKNEQLGVEDVTSTVDLRQIFFKLLGDEKLTDLASKLLDTIGREPDLEKALHLVENFYKEEVAKDVYKKT